MLGHLRALIGERHPLSSPEKLQQTETYLTDKFHHLGLDVQEHPFEALGATYRNVIGTLEAQQPEPSLIIAAHFDTVKDSPGADDNASGLAVLLEVARELRTVRLGRPVQFMAFNLEEEDLLGSLAYAAYLRASSREIVGAIVLECVGYARHEEDSQQTPPGVPVAVPTVGDFLAIVGNTDSRELVSSIERSANKQVPDLKTISLVVPGKGELLPDTRRSDHAAFWDHGFPAVMLTDTANFRNPNYHQPTDTIETVNVDFMSQVAAAVSAAAITLAGRSKS
ncbi:MAG: M28 family peptidase [Nitrospiraceae bacterium]